MDIVRLDLTTNAGGAASATDDKIIVGLLHAVRLEAGDCAAGVDLTLTCETPNLSIPLLTIADFNTDQMIYPRVLQNLNTQRVRVDHPHRACRSRENQSCDRAGRQCGQRES